MPGIAEALTPSVAGGGPDHSGANRPTESEYDLENVRALQDVLMGTAGFEPATSRV
jgi:hypothetical protein